MNPHYPWLCLSQSNIQHFIIWYERLLVIVVHLVVFNFDFMLYLLSPKLAQELLGIWKRRLYTHIHILLKFGKFKIKMKWELFYFSYKLIYRLFNLFVETPLPYLLVKLILLPLLHTVLLLDCLDHIIGMTRKDVWKTSCWKLYWYVIKLKIHWIWLKNKLISAIFKAPYLNFLLNRRVWIVCWQHTCSPGLVMDASKKLNLI